MVDILEEVGRGDGSVIEEYFDSNISQFGMDLIEQVVQMYDNYGFSTEVLVASVRNPLHVVDAAMMGADIVTMPFDVIKKLAKHPLTDIGLEKFLADWEKVAGG